MKYQIFLHIKRWLIEYGTDILDILLEPKDTTTLVHAERYENFLHELNRHFSTGTYYKSNFYSHLPLLTVQIHDVGYSSPCYHEYIIEFKYHWTTISADQEDNPENTPEAHLEEEDTICCLLDDMMKSQVIRDGRLVRRTLFTDLLRVKDFNAMRNVASIEPYPCQFLLVENEINTISKQFKLTIGECH